MNTKETITYLEEEKDPQIIPLGKGFEILNKDTRKMTRQERMEHLNDLEFEQLMFRNHWTEEEREERRKEFDREKRKEKKISRMATDYMLGAEDQPAFERAIAKKHIEEHPEEKEAFEQVLEMIGK